MWPTVVNNWKLIKTFEVANKEESKKMKDNFTCGLPKR